MQAENTVKVRRRGRHQSIVPLFDPVDATLDEPVERQVYRSLRRGMMSGLVSPDTVLSGRSLAQHLNLSVQPVRDALKRLEADGVIQGRPQSGFHLRGMTKSEYWEIIEIRQRLESLAGRHAISNMTPELIRKLRNVNTAMRDKSYPHEFLADNFNFHFTIYSQSRRANLLALIENFWVRIGPVLHLHTKPYTLDDTYQEHETIIAALERKDGDAVEAAIAEDLKKAAHVIVANLPES